MSKWPQAAMRFVKDQRNDSFPTEVLPEMTSRKMSYFARTAAGHQYQEMRVLFWCADVTNVLIGNNFRLNFSLRENII